MATCRECIHERVCFALIKTGLPYADDKYPAEAFCMAFKNKSDFVKVVRCGDCRMFRDNKEANTTYCTRELKNLTVKPDDFCSYGEKK